MNHPHQHQQNDAAAALLAVDPASLARELAEAGDAGAAWGYDLDFVDQYGDPATALAALAKTALGPRSAAACAALSLCFV